MEESQLREDQLVVGELTKSKWTQCERFTCEECPIEPDCPFEFLIYEEVQIRLEKMGYIVLYGPNGLWGVFQRYPGCKNKLHVLRDKELPDFV